jgi:hypothetical protein
MTRCVCCHSCVFLLCDWRTVGAVSLFRWRAHGRVCRVNRGVRCGQVEGTLVREMAMVDTTVTVVDAFNFLRDFRGLDTLDKRKLAGAPGALRPPPRLTL